jgi:transcription elongation factor Elf1
VAYCEPSDWAACPVCDGRTVETTIYSDGLADLACGSCGYGATVELNPVVRRQ